MKHESEKGKIKREQKPLSKYKRNERRKRAMRRMNKTIRKHKK